MNPEVNNLIGRVNIFINNGDLKGLSRELLTLKGMGLISREGTLKLVELLLMKDDMQEFDECIELIELLISPTSHPLPSDDLALIQILAKYYVSNDLSEHAPVINKINLICNLWSNTNKSSALSACQWLDMETYHSYLQSRDLDGQRLYELRALFRFEIPSESRSEEVSYIIPVLDLSPSTPGYNFLSLLERMTNLPGDVIVVFNNKALGDLYSSHPRITRSAVLSTNVGVPRAWSMGINLTETEYAILINSDANITKDCAYALTNALSRYPEVSMVGPVGFSRQCEFSHVNSTEPTFVDALAGFLFGVRTQEFQYGRFYFDPMLTPAFAEEEDLTQQFRAKGAKMLMVPNDGFEHAGSGSHLNLREIAYMNRSINKANLMARNVHYVRGKWRHNVESLNK